MKKTIQLSLIFFSLCCSSHSFTHHSVAPIFEMDKEITITGTVTEFRMGNPHARIYMDVASPNGEVVSWMAEGGSRTILLRTGWTGNEVQLGDKVSIIGNPSRNGSAVIHWKTIILADGTERFGEDLDPSLVENLRNKRRK